jgi:hypothetical protein
MAERQLGQGRMGGAASVIFSILTALDGAE